MTMTAIRLCEENIDAILAHTTPSISQTMLVEKVKKFGPDSVYGRALERKYYFIPSGYLDYAPDAWMNLAEDIFTQKFDADMTKIDTEFVEITRK